MSGSGFTRTLHFRLTAAFAVLIMLTAALIGTLLHQHTSRSLSELQMSRGDGLATILSRRAAEPLQSADFKAIDETLAALADQPFVEYAVVFDLSGAPVARWSAGGRPLPRTVTDPDEIVFNRREVSVAGGDVHETTLAILTAPMGDPRSADHADRLGTIRVGMSMRPVQRRVEDLERRIRRVVLAATLLGALASVVLVRSFLRPITRLIDATRRIAKGEFDSVTGVSAAGELKPLATALMTMSRAVRDTRARLVTANANLEQNVRRRTMELELAVGELQSLDRMKDGFLSNVSHELRTPLTSILASAEILLNFNDGNPQTQSEFLHIILVESHRLTRLVNDILDLVKIESGEIHWSLERIDVLQVAEEALSNLRPLLDEYGQTAEIHHTEPIPYVRANKARIAQVVENLISNAIKFSDRGRRVEVTARPHGQFGVEVIVTDQGIGIAPENQSRIFDRFRQVGDTLTEKPPGTGLGLPICRHIVLRHGGAIWVESRHDAGSEFHFTLPICGPDKTTMTQPMNAVASVPELCETHV